MKLYQMANVVSRDETAPSGVGGPTAPSLGCHLCPLYFTLDILKAEADIVRKFAIINKLQK